MQGLIPTIKSLFKENVDVIWINNENEMKLEEDLSLI